MGNILRTIKWLLESPAFDRATHRAGAYLLYFSNLCLPLGLHRLWMQLPGFWWFPTAFAVAAYGALSYAHTHAVTWKMLSLPYAFLFIMDFWVLATAPIPTRSNK